ncbi:MAG: hypothetical protein QXF97_06440 [Candidatus Caldarchaeum sp.]
MVVGSERETEAAPTAVNDSGQGAPFQGKVTIENRDVVKTYLIKIEYNGWADFYQIEIRRRERLLEEVVIKNSEGTTRISREKLQLLRLLEKEGLI